MKKINSIIWLFSVLILSGCATYHLSTENLLKQLSETKLEKKNIALIVPPFFIPFQVTGNSLRQVKVLDKTNNETTISVTNHTSVRIWKKDGSKKTFYFNTLLIKDSLITGKNDHFIGTNIKPINLNNIDRIEIQK